MTIAEDIELPRDAGLIQKSRRLTEETIELLQRSGISRINIVDPAIIQQKPGKSGASSEATTAPAGAEAAERHPAA